MPDEASSPSGGWREVYDAMDASTSAESDGVPCPDCGDECPRVRPDRYWCPDHGTFAAVG